MILLPIFAHHILVLFRRLSSHFPYLEKLFRLSRFFTSHSGRFSMDFFGNALEDYYSNNLKSKFMFSQHCLQSEYNGIKWEVNLGRYFRTLDKFYPLEKKLIDLARGNILDVGSCTGYFIPYLMAKGTTTGIEISSKVINISRKEGIHNCILGNIFAYKFNSKFDTITLIGNDIALSGTLFRLKKLLKKFAQLLNKNGQVLLIIKHIQTLKYWHVVFVPYYDGHIGIPFKLLFLNVHFFSKFVLKYGFRATILGKDKSTGILYYLVRLIKTST